MNRYFIEQPSILTAVQVIELFANLNQSQSIEKSERARGFLARGH